MKSSTKQLNTIRLVLRRPAFKRAVECIPDDHREPLRACCKDVYRRNRGFASDLLDVIFAIQDANGWPLPLQALDKIEGRDVA